MEMRDCMQVQRFETYAKGLKRNIKFRVILPKGYEQNTEKKYPVLYMQDGQDILSDDEATDGQSMNYASYYKKYWFSLPEIIIVAADCPMNNAERTRLYSPYHKCFDVKDQNFESEIDGQAREYLYWMVHDLKPWVDQNYRTKAGREFTAIGGSSTGGLAALYAVLAYPETFTRIFSLSGAFYIWFDCLEDSIEQANFDYLKYAYLDVGREDHGRFTTKEQFVEGNERLYQIFMELGFDDTQIEYQVFDYDRHEHKSLGRRFPDAIRWIFQDIMR